MNKNIALIFLLVILVSGCMEPTLKSSTPRAVLVEKVTSSNLDKALEIAENECAKYDKHAVYKSDNTPDGITNYECVD
jgi:hypothetical protein